MVGCVPYETEKEHFAIMRGDGLSHHPLRKHISKDPYKRPMGLGGGSPDAEFPKPANWLTTYRKSIPNINDFMVVDRKQGGGQQKEMSDMARLSAWREEVRFWSPVVCGVFTLLESRSMWGPLEVQRAVL